MQEPLVSIIILISEYKRSEVLNEKSLENLVYDRMMELDRLLIENPDLAEIVVTRGALNSSVSVKLLR